MVTANGCRFLTSLLGCIDPTGLFSLTYTSCQISVIERGQSPRTDTNNSLLELRCRHSLQHTGSDVTQIKQVCELHCSLLNLELCASSIRCKNGLDSLLLGCCRCWSRRDFRERGEYELTSEVVRVGRVQSGNEQIDEFCIRYLGQEPCVRIPTNAPAIVYSLAWVDPHLQDRLQV